MINMKAFLVLALVVLAASSISGKAIEKEEPKQEQKGDEKLEQLLETLKNDDQLNDQQKMNLLLYPGLQTVYPAYPSYQPVYPGYYPRVYPGRSYQWAVNRNPYGGYGWGVYA